MNIQYGSQNLNNINKKNLMLALNNSVVTNGNYCKKFETKICKITKSKFTVVCNNGTSALYLSILSIFKNKPIFAIVPNINFVSAISILYHLNAKIILCDVNSNGMIDKETFEDCLNKISKKKIKPNLFIPIHYAGLVCDISDISKICRKKNIKIIEDGCHSFGSSFKNKNKKIIVGQSKHSLCTTFSFHPVKNITTIEGGAITTNNKSLYKKMLLLRNHGLERTKINEPYKLFYPSLNFRLGEINAVIGIDQIKNVSKFKKERQELVNYYLKKIGKFSKFFKPLNFKTKNIFWHLFVIKFIGKNKLLKAKLMKFLKLNRINTQIHYKPIYQHEIYRDKIVSNFHTNSLKFYEEQLTLPLHTKLK
jgi:dTDP-4-amino-4,6-dideoxygalactose transaminase